MKRSRSIYPLAAALLTAISWIVIQQTCKNPVVPLSLSHTQVRKPTTHRQLSANNAAPIARRESQAEIETTAGSSPLSEKPEVTSTGTMPSASRTKAPASAKRSPGVGATGKRASAKASAKSPVQTNPNRGIQLAENVKLPAAVMAMADPSFGKLTPQQKTALQNVIDTFYRELASQAESKLSDQEPTDIELVQSASGEETIVIQPGPDVEKARNRANEIFRALFGDDRYNQITMRSAMESMMPPLTDGNR